MKTWVEQVEGRIAFLKAQRDSVREMFQRKGWAPAQFVATYDVLIQRIEIDEMPLAEELDSRREERR